METNYKYQPDDATIDIDDDELYGYTLEREALHRRNCASPSCMMKGILARARAGDGTDMRPACAPETGEGEEHFTLSSKNWMKNAVIIIIILIVLYFLYTLLCGKKETVVYEGDHDFYFKR